MRRIRERPRILTLQAADFGLSDASEGLMSALRRAPRAKAGSPAQQDFRGAVTSFERTLLLDALARHDQTWAAAARELGMDRANLNRLAKRLGLK